jgi:hypothetical protein
VYSASMSSVAMFPISPFSGPKAPDAASSRSSATWHARRRLRCVSGSAASSLHQGLTSSTFQLNLSRFGHTSPCPPVK